jgi:hypothetical protein
MRIHINYIPFERLQLSIFKTTAQLARVGISSDLTGDCLQLVTANSLPSLYNHLLYGVMS